MHSGRGRFGGYAQKPIGTPTRGTGHAAGSVREGFSEEVKEAAYKLLHIFVCDLDHCIFSQKNKMKGQEDEN